MVSLSALREALADRAAGPKLLSLRAMAERLHLNPAWLLIQAIKGLVPHVDTDEPGGVLFNPQAVENALAERAKTEGLRGQPGGDSDRE